MVKSLWYSTFRRNYLAFKIDDSWHNSSSTASEYINWHALRSDMVGVLRRRGERRGSNSTGWIKTMCRGQLLRGDTGKRYLYFDLLVLLEDQSLDRDLSEVVRPRNLTRVMVKENFWLAAYCEFHGGYGYIQADKRPVSLKRGFLSSVEI